MLRTRPLMVCLVAALLAVCAILPLAAAAAPGAKRIDVNLTTQRLNAYHVDGPVRFLGCSFVATGRTS